MSKNLDRYVGYLQQLAEQEREAELWAVAHGFKDFEEAEPLLARLNGHEYAAFIKYDWTKKQLIKYLERRNAAPTPARHEGDADAI